MSIYTYICILSLTLRSFSSSNTVFSRFLVSQCRRSVELLLGIKRCNCSPLLRSNGRDVVRLMAQLLWATRGSLAWDLSSTESKQSD